MLQAVIKKKLQRHLREPEKPPEDLITDCFFGPLRYLGARDAGRALAQVCQDSRKAAFNALEGAEVTDVELWPRRNRVEPDVMVHCSDASGNPLRLMVEVKWDAPLGDAQALRQWRAFRTGNEGGDRLLHLVICRRADLIEEEIESQAGELKEEGRRAFVDWRNRRLVLTWFDVARRLRDGNGPAWSSTQLRRWALDIQEVLWWYGERPFRGFAPIPTLAGDHPIERPIFWAHEPAFRWPIAKIIPQHHPIFWQLEVPR